MLKKTIAAASLLAVLTALAAGDVANLLPPFGAEGAAVSTAAQNGHKVSGWLPANWVDNTEWAAVTATYTKLDDPPAPGLGAVRIQVDKADDGQLQLTTWTKPVFKRGVKYVAEGWIRSAAGSGLRLGIRQPADPYEFYFEQELTGTAAWQKFSAPFSFDEDREAFVMFCKQDTGAVDVAGLVVRPAGP